MIYDHLSRATLYPLGSSWQQAVEFLNSLSPNTPDGEISIQGDRVFARVMSYRTKLPQEAVLESHRIFADIQVLLSGEEILEWYPRHSLEVSTPYRPESEAEFYTRTPPAPVRIHLRPGMFVLLHPHDAHMPSLRVSDTAEPVRKVVVKIAVDLLTGICEITDKS